MANFTELDRYLFGQATHYDIYRKLGAHFAEVKGVKGVYPARDDTLCCSDNPAEMPDAVPDA